MRFPPQFLDELRARLPVSEVVGRRVKLRKTGREWVGLSPFNKEKTPSFFVNDQKGFYHDFSSGKNGDIFGFVMETEGVAFPGGGRAARADGRRADAEVRQGGRGARREAQDAARRHGARGEILRGDAWPGAAAPRRAAISPIAASSPATQLKFRLGYAPGERFALKEHLGGQGISVEDMVETGLLIAGDDIPVPYDRFRDRVMFPITDFRGRIIAFGGRALATDAPAKYLNSPETPLFHKGSNLYNGAVARQAVHDGARADRGRGLCRRDRHGRRRLSGDGRAARHRAHRRSARPALEDGRRADPLLRRRQGRPARRLPRRRPGAAAAAARQEPALCPAARGPGPGRSLSLRRPRGDRRGARRRAPARRHAVEPRDRSRLVRHAGAARRARGARARGGARHRRRSGAQILRARISRRGCARCWRRRRRRDAASVRAANADNTAAADSAARPAPATSAISPAAGIPSAAAAAAEFPAAAGAGEFAPLRRARSCAATAPRCRRARR